MAQLFDKDSDTIGLHLRNIYQSKELVEDTTTEFFSVVQLEGKRQVKRSLKLYNLDAIISVGYRVNSKRGIQFCIWATSVIKDYLLNGYAIDNKRLIEENNKLKELQFSDAQCVDLRPKTAALVSLMSFMFFFCPRISTN